MTKPTWLSYPATGVVAGDPVYFAYQAFFKDKKTGQQHCLVADTKQACIDLVKDLRPDLVVKEEWIHPVAIMRASSVGITGGLHPFSTQGASHGRMIPATESKRPKSTPVVEDDDLI